MNLIQDFVQVSCCKTGDIQVADLIEEYGKDRLILHLAQILAKEEQIVYEFDKTWLGSVDDLPPERAIGLYGIYDSEGYSIKNNSSIKGKQGNTFGKETSKTNCTAYENYCYLVLF